MVAARSTSQSAIGISDHYLFWLAIVLAGYALLGKLVAYIGHPPLFIGEILLFAGAAVAVRTRCLPAALASPPAILLAICMSWVLLRTLPYIGVYGFNALRDSVVIMYGAFAFIVVALLLEDGSRVATVLKYYSRFAGFYIPAVPFAFALAFYAPGALLFIRPGEMAVHLAGATVFTIAGFRRFSPLSLICLAAALMMAMTISRSAMLSFVVPVMLGALLLGKARELVLVVVAGLLVIGVAYGLEKTFTDASVAQRNSTDRTLSVTQMVENATSIFTQSGGQTEGTKAWRLDWWNIIVNDTLYGPHFWTGRGFGLNLANADGFWNGDIPQHRRCEARTTPI